MTHVQVIMGVGAAVPLSALRTALRFEERQVERIEPRYNIKTGVRLPDAKFVDISYTVEVDGIRTESQEAVAMLLEGLLGCRIFTANDQWWWSSDFALFLVRNSHDYGRTTEYSTGSEFFEISSPKPLSLGDPGEDLVACDVLVKRLLDLGLAASDIDVGWHAMTAEV